MSNQRSSPVRPLWSRFKTHPLARIGPGLITGVADDDPSGIATYSQAGAQFGLDALWTMPVALPMMVAVQLMCARIGRVTGKGIAANIKEAFHPTVVRTVVALLLITNTLNIAADIAAMGEAAELVTGLNRHAMTLVFTLLSLGLQVLVPYRRYVVFLRWLTLSLLAYVLVLFTVHVPWRQVAWHTLSPHLALNVATVTVLLGVFGTTISPYLFFWQASEEIEDMSLQSNAKPLRVDARQAVPELRRIHWDTWTGMFYSDLIGYFIILATAVTLHVAGITQIQTAAQAAEALRPLAGEFASVVFAVGIMAVGLIAVPVLAGSAAYAVSETMSWKASLDAPVLKARGFYGIITLSCLVALSIQYSPITPMQALFWSAVINGVVAVPVVAVIVVLASRRSVMGPFTSHRLTQCVGWLTVIVMGAAVIRMLWPN
jgi:Mn2+/Fe2+ NRAMP family transporter